jgi:hypothetical protein
MAVEPLTEPIMRSEPEPTTPAAEPSRSRRSLLGAGLAGLAGLVLGSFAKPEPADAAAGGSLIMGASNSAGTTNTDLSTNSTGTALYIHQNGTGAAIRGIANDGIAGFFTSSNGSGVSGVVANNTKYGVYGANDATTHSTGAGIRANGEHNNGIYATTADATSFAVRAVNTNAGTGSSAGAGIRVLAGGAADVDIDAVGAYHAAGEFCGANGVVGVGTDSLGYGVYGYSDSGEGVYGCSDSSYGVYGYSSTGYGVYSASNARVSGDLSVIGTLSKGGGSFKIDHPLDPANKFLYHSFVESPDMLNVYSGTVTLDAGGEATVTLPDWFEALNRDARIQLTAVGEFSPLFVKSKVHDGAFSIAGGKASQEVFWQLTGIRQDAWANAHRIPVEQEKPAAERGLYLHPVENGQPAAKGIDEVRHAAMKPHASK